ncbi:MAG TPA: hypothetical protein VHO23_01115 [Candidatus Paceibacterota bacterium]|nr:hypothetical protein [Candidatus Paceibacterota bacterium]
MKRVLILIAGALVLIGLLVGAYFLFFAGNGTGLTATPGGTFGTADDRAGGLGAVTDTGVPVSGAGTQVAPRLLQLSSAPVAKGAFSLYTPAQTATASSSTATGTPETVVTVPEETEVRYIDRQSGNVYSFRIHERVMTRLSNKTLPGIEEANWSRSGDRAFVRFLEGVGDGQERISTFMLPANGEGGYFLEQDIEQVLVASTSIVTRTASGSGSSVASASLDGTGAVSLFTSPLRSIMLSYFGSGFIATTKPSASLDGYSFSVDRAGSFTRLLGPLAGLSTLASPDASRVLYTYSDRGKIVTQVLSLADRTTVPLPLATLPEKCVWSSDSATLYCGVPTALTGTLPDDWHQGARAFSDRIWKIDLATRVATLVFDPVQLADTQIDAISLTLDNANDVLVFMNKTDGSLWSYDL